MKLFTYIFRKSILSTTGKRPFAPRSPGDIGIGAVVKFSRQNGKISKGLVRYIGHLPGRNDTYLGLELENEGKEMILFLCLFLYYNKATRMWFLREQKHTNDGLWPRFPGQRPSRVCFCSLRNHERGFIFILKTTENQLLILEFHTPSSP
jgi:hypothetical protein